MKLVLATKNMKKLGEMREILKRLDIEVFMQSELGYDIDVPETGSEFSENALLKAKAVMEASGMPSVSDDSGLVVDALGGAPGVYSARYGGPDIKNDNERTELLLKNMEHIPDRERGARFVSCICCAFPDGRVITARGECEGHIIRDKRGTGGFGYDPVFYLPEYGKTMAELSPELKNRISHRAKSLETFRKKLEEFKI